MTEANNNANSFNSEFNLEFLGINENNQESREEASATASKFNLEQDNSPSNHASEQVLVQSNSQETEQSDSGEQKMNWQKVAHKLREYNRKLLKKVFRLEQELADIDNKFTKYVEKSRSSDVLVAQQEQEIRKYQEKTESFDRQIADHQAIIDQKEVMIISLSQQHELSQRQTAQLELEVQKYQEKTESFDRQMADCQAIIDQKEVIMSSLSKQHELSQQQAAQLERDCALLQENYNHRVYELTAKDKEIKELQNKFSQQQRAALQYQAELKRYQEQETIPAAIPIKEPVVAKQQNYSQSRTIKPWSTSVGSQTNVALPKTQSIPIAAKKTAPSEAVKTAAKIATWSASQVNEQRGSQKTKTKTNSQSSVKVKPKSLAAVDLPTFPRPV